MFHHQRIIWATATSLTTVFLLNAPALADGNFLELHLNNPSIITGPGSNNQYILNAPDNVTQYYTDGAGDNAYYTVSGSNNRSEIDSAMLGAVPNPANTTTLIQNGDSNAARSDLETKASTVYIKQT